MIVKKVIPCGYCKGVIGAINLAKKTKQDNPNKNVYVLGMLVHNQHVIEELNKQGIITLDDTNTSKEDLLNKISDGIVIFTAHGISKQIKQKAIDKGLQIVDASCEDVLKTHAIIEDYINKGYDVLFYGIKNHPETLASLSISNNIHLIASKEDINNLQINNDKLVLTSQTTMSNTQFMNIANIAKEKYPNIIIEKQICNATTLRQQAIIDLKDCDLLYIVGDKKSNNTNKLVSIALEKGIKKVFLIEDVNEINDIDLKGINNVYVGAGASTPSYLIDEVIEYLSSKSFN